MKTRRRRGRRTGLPAVNGLVSLAVFELFMDIRRKRRLAQSVKDFLKNPPIMELHKPPAKIGVTCHFAGKLVSKTDRGAAQGFFPRLHQSFPNIALDTAEQKHFNTGACRLFLPNQPRRNDARVIENQRVARNKELAQFKKAAMLDRPLYGVNHHEPRRVPRLHRRLSNQFFRQFIIKIR